MQPLDGEQLTRNCADMLLVGRVDFIAPLPRPLIQILPTAEGASRQKVILDEMEGTLHAPRTVTHSQSRAPQTESRSALQRRPSPAPAPCRARCRAAPPRACYRS